MHARTPFPRKSSPAALLLALAALAAPLGAQEQPSAQASVATMSGRVVDAQTGQPVPGVLVRLPEKDIQTVTDGSGGFVLQVPPGTQQWAFSRIGYAAWQGESEVADGDWFTVRLLPRPVVLAGLDVTVSAFEARRRASLVPVQSADQADFAAGAIARGGQVLRSIFSILPVSCGRDRDVGCIERRQQVIRPRVYIDDVEASGGLKELDRLSTADIYLVEIYDGGAIVLVYTENYVEQLARESRRPQRVLPATFADLDPWTRTMECQEIRDGLSGGASLKGCVTREERDARGLQYPDDWNPGRPQVLAEGR